MSRKKRILRKVSNPPIIKGFKPYGLSFDEKREEIKLLYEEYEALRLCDYDLLNHHQASIMMGVSRPTFTRIYASALQKIAKAFVEGRQISIEGGKVYFDSDWYQCDSCGCFFNNPEKEYQINNCPLCKSINIQKYEDIIDEEHIDLETVCVCSKCGYEFKHNQGKSRSSLICPECNSVMSKNDKC